MEFPGNSKSESRGTCFKGIRRLRDQESYRIPVNELPVDWITTMSSFVPGPQCHQLRHEIMDGNSCRTEDSVILDLRKRPAAQSTSTSSNNDCNTADSDDDVTIIDVINRSPPEKAFRTAPYSGVSMRPRATTLFPPNPLPLSGYQLTQPQTTFPHGSVKQKVPNFTSEYNVFHNPHPFGQSSWPNQQRLQELQYNFPTMRVQNTQCPYYGHPGFYFHPNASYAHQNHETNIPRGDDFQPHFPSSAYGNPQFCHTQMPGPQATPFSSVTNPEPGVFQNRVNLNGGSSCLHTIKNPPMHPPTRMEKCCPSTAFMPSPTHGRQSTYNVDAPAPISRSIDADAVMNTSPSIPTDDHHENPPAIDKTCSPPKLQLPPSSSSSCNSIVNDLEPSVSQDLPLSENDASTYTTEALEEGMPLINVNSAKSPIIVNLEGQSEIGESMSGEIPSALDINPHNSESIEDIESYIKEKVIPNTTTLSKSPNSADNFITLHYPDLNCTTFSNPVQASQEKSKIINPINPDAELFGNTSPELPPPLLANNAGSEILTDNYLTEEFPLTEQAVQCIIHHQPKPCEYHSEKTDHMGLSPALLVTWGMASEKQKSISQTLELSQDRLQTEGQLIHIRGLGRPPKVDVKISTAPLMALAHYQKELLHSRPSRKPISTENNVKRTDIVIPTEIRNSLKECFVKLHRLNETQIPVKQRPTKMKVQVKLKPLKICIHSLAHTAKPDLSNHSKHRDSPKANDTRKSPKESKSPKHKDYDKNKSVNAVKVKSQQKSGKDSGPKLQFTKKSSHVGSHSKPYSEKSRTTIPKKSAIPSGPNVAPQVSTSISQPMEIPIHLVDPYAEKEDVLDLFAEDDDLMLF